MLTKAPPPKKTKSKKQRQLVLEADAFQREKHCKQSDFVA